MRKHHVRLCATIALAFALALTLSAFAKPSAKQSAKHPAQQSAQQPAQQSASATGADGELSSLLASSGGAYSAALKDYYMKRAEAEVRATASNVPADTWTWLDAHPQIRDGLLSASYPVPALYVENLAALRASLGPQISEKYPQLLLAMSIRPDSVTDAANATASPAQPEVTNVDNEDADADAALTPEEAPSKPDPQAAKIAAYMKANNRTLVDIVKNPAPVFKALGLALPKKHLAPLWNDVALASGTYPSRLNMPLVDYLKYIIAHYETRLPKFTTQTQWQWPVFPLDKAPWPLLLALRPEPQNEADWVWQLFTGGIKPPEAKGKRVMTYGTYTGNYRQPEVHYQASQYNPDSAQRIAQDGGICGRMASLAKISFNSLGQPASGVGQPGHATLFYYSYDAASGKYVTRVQTSLNTPFKTHARWYIPNVKGFRTQSKNNTVGIEYHDGLALAMDAGLDSYVDTRVACKLAAMLPDTARAQKIRLLESAAALNPCNVELWYALVALHEDEPAQVNALVARIEQLLPASSGQPKNLGGKTDTAANPAQDMAATASAMDEVVCSEIVLETYTRALADKARLADNYKLLQTEIARRQGKGLQYDPTVQNLAWRYDLALNGIAGVKDKITAALTDAIRGTQKHKTVADFTDAVPEVLANITNVDEKIAWLQTLRDAFPPDKAFVRKKDETAPNQLYRQLYEDQVKILKKLGPSGAARLRALQDAFQAQESATPMQLTPEMSSNIAPAPFSIITTSAFSNDDEGRGFCAFNRSHDDSGWITASNSFAAPNYTGSQSITIHLGAPSTLTYYKLFSRGWGEDDDLKQFPADWQVSVSSDGKNFQVVDKQTGVARPIDFDQEYTYALQAPAACSYVRITITRARCDLAAIGEIELYGTQSNQAQWTQPKEKKKEKRAKNGSENNGSD